MKRLQKDKKEKKLLALKNSETTDLDEGETATKKK